jgi:hypothetical protein
MELDYTAPHFQQQMTETGPRYVPRAPRFMLPSWILYRPAGEMRWREGRTENISRSGVLFHGVEPVGVETPVEIMMTLPTEVMGLAPGASLGRGRIVRLDRRPDARPALAAAITGWESVQLDPGQI